MKRVFLNFCLVLAILSSQVMASNQADLYPAGKPVKVDVVVQISDKCKVSGFIQEENVLRVFTDCDNGRQTIGIAGKAIKSIGFEYMDIPPGEFRPVY